MDGPASIRPVCPTTVPHGARGALNAAVDGPWACKDHARSQNYGESADEHAP